MTDPSAPDVAELERRISDLRQGVRALRARVGESFLGHGEALETLVQCVLADGHVLLEGAPGLGKTTLVRALAGALDLRFRRVQATPDLMPADILGTRILQQDEDGRRRFEFEPGPVFTNVLLADEINRATPRTQAALLEAMQERQVTGHGETRRLEEPFCVIATQNPIEMEGTYPLPEAQLDRFLAKVELRAPSEDELVAILDATTGPPPGGGEPVLDREQVLSMRALVREVPAGADVVRRVARVVQRTDPADERAPEDVRRYLRYGASPRGGQAVLMLAKARALLEGRVHVADEDVDAVAAPALRHRLVYGYEGEAAGVHPDALVAAALAAACG